MEPLAPGHGAFEEQETVFVIHFDDFNLGYGVGGGAVMTGHALAGKHFTQGTAGAQGTRSSFSIGGAVGSGLTGKAVAFHRAGKAVAFGFSLHVNIIAGFKNFIE